MMQKGIVNVGLGLLRTHTQRNKNGKKLLK